jgi:hypothetical protein
MLSSGITRTNASPGARRLLNWSPTIRQIQLLHQRADSINTSPVPRWTTLANPFSLMDDLTLPPQDPWIRRTRSRTRASLYMKGDGQRQNSLHYSMIFQEDEEWNSYRESNTPSSDGDRSSCVIRRRVSSGEEAIPGRWLRSSPFIVMIEKNLYDAVSYKMPCTMSAVSRAFPFKAGSNPRRFADGSPYRPIAG